MKVEQQKSEFTPVTITLETQDEYDWFVSCLGHTNPFRAPWSELYQQMKGKRKALWTISGVNITKPV